MLEGKKEVDLDRYFTTIRDQDELGDGGWIINNDKVSIVVQ